MRVFGCGRRSRLAPRYKERTPACVKIWKCVRGSLHGGRRALIFLCGLKELAVPSVTWGEESCVFLDVKAIAVSLMAEEDDVSMCVNV